MLAERLDEVLDGTSFALFDGAMGTMLVRQGLAGGELPELLCLEDPQKITAIHRAYVEAGSQFITTNTFGANRRKLAGQADVAEIFTAAMSCAREAGARFVAADMGPLGELFFPMGSLGFSEAYELFAEQARAAEAAGADVVIIETMADVTEVAAAVLAVKENSKLPVFATMTFTEMGRTFLGVRPSVAALALSLLGVNALGVNCSAGPADLQPVVMSILESTNLPVIVQANAGLPQVVGGETVYTLTPDEYLTQIEPMVAAGATILGGCCGTDPTFISGLAKLIENRDVTARQITSEQVRKMAEETVEEGGRDAEILELILEAGDSSELKQMLSEEYDPD